jgi:hypothetical protein
MSNNRNRHFNRGQSTFTCNSCDRLTRDTGQGRGISCCLPCYEIAGIDNMVNDENMKPGSSEYVEAMREAEGFLKIIAKAGGNVEKVKVSFDYLWV